MLPLVPPGIFIQTHGLVSSQRFICLETFHGRWGMRDLCHVSGRKGFSTYIPPVLINSSRRQICSLFFQKPLLPQLGAGSGPRMVGQAQVQLFEGSLIPAPQPAAQPAVSNLCQHSCLHCVFQAFNYFHLFQELSMRSCVSGP